MLYLFDFIAKQVKLKLSTYEIQLHQLKIVY